MRSNSNSGYRGIHKRKNNNLYMVYIQSEYIGCANTLQKALDKQMNFYLKHYADREIPDYILPILNDYKERKGLFERPPPNIIIEEINPKKKSLIIEL